MTGQCHQKLRGTIVTLDRGQSGLLECGDLYYRFALSPEQAGLSPRCGDQAEFEMITPCTSSWGEARILELHPVETLSDRMYLSREQRPPDVESVATGAPLVLISEGRSAGQCLLDLEQAAAACHANALLGLEYQAVRRPLCRNYLSRYSACPAQVRGAGHVPPPGRQLAVSADQARPNYASEARIRQVRMLLVFMLMILIPCLLGLSARDILDYKIAYNIMLVAVVLSIYYGFRLNPRDYRTYLHRQGSARTAAHPPQPKAPPR